MLYCKVPLPLSAFSGKRLKMKTKISVACKKAIEWQPCDLRNTNEKYSMYYAQGSSRGYMYVAQISAGRYWWIIKYCCRSCPQVYVGSPALYKANISKVNVYSLPSCPYLHCHALALASGDHLLFYLWVTRKFLSLFSTFMLGILNSWDQSIFVS